MRREELEGVRREELEGVRRGLMLEVTPQLL